MYFTNKKKIGRSNPLSNNTLLENRIRRIVRKVLKEGVDLEKEFPKIKSAIKIVVGEFGNEWYDKYTQSDLKSRYGLKNTEANSSNIKLALSNIKGKVNNETYSLFEKGLKATLYLEETGVLNDTGEFKLPDEYDNKEIGKQIYNFAEKILS